MKPALTPIPFADIAGRALASATSLLGQWLPDGVLRSGEYSALNPLRADSKRGSFSVNINSGKWGDFATDDAGNDLISLYAYLNGLEQWEAALEVADLIGFVLPDGCRPAAQKDKPRKAPVIDPAKVKTAKKAAPSPWVPITPVPDGAPESHRAHSVRGLPSKRWDYLDGAGRLLGTVCRFETSGGGKETLPLTFCKHSESGKSEWRWMQWRAPNRPMYGLDRLADKHKPVLLVEGEKCADAAVDLIGDEFAIVSWPGGSKAIDKVDWRPLAGRKVVAWPDCDAKREKLSKAEKDAGIDARVKPFLSEHDQPGTKAMRQIAKRLFTLDANTVFEMVMIPRVNTVADGWDIADAVEQGYTRKPLIQLIFNRQLLTAESLAADDSDKKSKTPTTQAGEGAAKTNAPIPINPIPNNIVPMVQKAVAKMSDNPSAALPVEKKAASDKAGEDKDDIDWDRYQWLIDNFVLIYTTDTVFDEKQGVIMKINALRLAFGSSYVKLWLGSDRRRMILPEELVFDPTQTCKPPCINLYKGLAMAPEAKTDVGPILDLVEHLCNNTDSPTEFNDTVEWVLRWLAYPLQNPGAKMQTALVVHGPQGAGKNLLFDMVRDIYGDYGKSIGQEQLNSDFNDWASKLLFAIGDEVVARSELFHEKNRLKKFITDKTIQINPKGMPLRTEANHCNVVFLSNETRPIALEVGDRRYMVIYTPHKRTDDLYERVAKCIDNGGIASFYAYLMDLDLEDFNAHTKPIVTGAKQDLIELNLRPEELFAYKLIGKETPLPLSVCSTDQLYKVFVSWVRNEGYRYAPDQTQFTKNIAKTFEAIGHKKDGGPSVMVKKKVRLPADSKQQTVYVWVPIGCAPPDGVTWGDFAMNAIDDYKENLGVFRAFKHESDD